MKRINLTKERIGSAIKTGCQVVIPVLSAVLLYGPSVENIRRKVRYIGNASYSDAIDAILVSDMFSSGKDTVIKLLPKDGDSEFYKSVIRIVDSDMFTSGKVDVITSMCEKTK